MNINWARKLTSRKFWVAVANFVSMLLVFFNYSESTATQVASLIMAGATVIAYIIGEGLADSGSYITNNYSAENEFADNLDTEYPVDEENE